MSGPLDGVRVVEFTHLIRGPQCGALMQTLGAQVIKIEAPGVGDTSRRIPIGPGDARFPYLHAHNRGKRSVALDVRTPEGFEVAKRLIERADVLIATLRPGALDGIGLGYEICAEWNPRLIYAVGSTYGPDGELADRPGVDLLAQAMGGLVSKTGSPEQPMPAGSTVADSAAAQLLFGGITAALFARERSGRGQRVDGSLYGGQIWSQGGEISYQLIAGVEYPRIAAGQPNLSNWSLHSIFETSDGHLAIPGVGPDQWEGFCDALEDARLRDDRFADVLSRVTHIEELRELVAEILTRRSRDEWVSRLTVADVRHAPVQSYAEVEADPQARINGYLVEVEHPDWGPMVSLGSPLAFSDTPAEPAVRAPELGEQTEEVLLELGYDWDAIEGLREAGAI